MSATGKSTETIDLDLLFRGSFLDFSKEDGFATKLDRALKSTNELLSEIKIKVKATSQRAKGLSLGDLELLHLNFTLSISSENPLGELFWGTIWPAAYKEHLAKLLESENCVVLEDLHSGEYFQAMAQKGQEIQKGVLGILAKDHPDIPQDFAKSILSARPQNAP